MRIHLLEPLTANQIAAGEVIARPASVVKEIIENSLDANASKIELDIEKGGTQLIRLTDNGSGIHKDDLKLALSRHGTSKIRSLDDLYTVNTLGFRGEALASIASVSRLTLSSCQKGESAAWQITAEGTEMNLSLSPVAHPQGSTIEVRDLFFNTPARRKFLRADRTEFSHIEEIVKRIALSHFERRVALQHNQRNVFMLTAATTAIAKEQRISKLCGNDFINNALEISFESDYLKLWGWIATPNFTKTNTNLQYFYLNRRTIRDKLINHAVRQAYQDSLPQGRYPAYVLYLKIDPAAVDVNVHPTKHEVRFREARLIHDFIFRNIFNALHTKPNEQPTDKQQFITPEYVPHLQPIANQEAAALKDAPHTTIPNPWQTAPTKPSSIRETINAYQALHESVSIDDAIGTATNNSNSDIVQEKVQPQQTAPLLGQAIAQLHSRYILAQNDAGLVLVDILKAQRGLLYYQMKEALITKKFISQPLLIPVTIHLKSTEISFVEKKAGSFNQLGIALEPLGPDSILIRKLPTLLRDADIAKMITTVIKALMQTKPDNSSGDNEFNHLLQLLANHGVKETPQTWTLPEMNTLLEKLEHYQEQIKNGVFSPLWVKWTIDEVEKLF